MIELPQLKSDKSGLTKAGKTWRVIYYVDKVMMTWGTTESCLKRAVMQRNAFHERKLKEGAVYRGRNFSSAINDAVNDPEGDACIYTQTSYRVLVEGVHVTTTTDKELAKRRRNEYIAANYTIQ